MLRFIFSRHLFTLLLAGFFLVSTESFARSNSETIAEIKKAQQAMKADDYKSAVRILTPIADEGNTFSEFLLGIILRNGFGGVAKDPELAFKYILKAAEKDHWSAQYSIAGMYAMGSGVEKNPEAALKWAIISAARGSKAGLSLAKKLRKELSDETRIKAQAIADKWSKVTLIDGRPANEHKTSCPVIKLQIKEAKDFKNNIKNKNSAKELYTASGAIRWSSLVILYPSGDIALDDIGRRLDGLLEVKSAKGCS
ncbi:MAG: sel1 repeat family protein [Rhodospirillaceae bacterium]|nr:sel1 repeat family protein [Rhodospirillaceae bacterium]